MVWSLAQTSLGRSVMIVPVCGFSGFGNVRDGASNCASRISRSTRAFDVRTSRSAAAPTLCDGLRRKTEKLPSTSRIFSSNAASLQAVFGPRRRNTRPGCAAISR